MLQRSPECRWSEDDNQFIESDPLLPTRVIDIGESVQEIPRLILSNGSRGKWAALSHRWPQDASKILRLVADNIKDMQRAIPRESLAATFQDALRIIRVLGLRYLWVDSLCILQDSPADWKEQSSRMPISTRMHSLPLLPRRQKIVSVVSSENVTGSQHRDLTSCWWITRTRRLQAKSSLTSASIGITRRMRKQRPTT